MKKYLLALVLLLSATACEKEVSYSQLVFPGIEGTWALVSYTGHDGITRTDTCITDNRLIIRHRSAGDRAPNSILSQGECVAYPWIPVEQHFTSTIIPNKTHETIGQKWMTFGGDTAKIVKLTQDTLHFERRPEFSRELPFEYIWKRVN